MKKNKIITSYSNVITNSSTQVFFLDITENLINLLKDNKMIDEVIIINNKEDVIMAIETYELEQSTRSYGSSSYLIFEVLYNVCPDMYGIFSEYGKGEIWEALNKAGRTDREIIDFIWPVISEVSGKLFYSFLDDCGTTRLAELLWKNGYPSSRQ